MEYSEEEISVLKAILENKEKILSIDIPDETKRTLNIVLNLIEKQQKEIYELKNQTQIISPLYVKENYIPKEAIREKVKGHKERIRNLHPASDCVIIDDLENQIKAYEELLGE